MEAALDCKLNEMMKKREFADCNQ